MPAQLTRRAILAAIAEEHPELYGGGSYFYFVYDDGERGIYGDHSVHVPRLSHLILEQWISEGWDLVARVKAEEAA